MKKVLIIIAGFIGAFSLQGQDYALSLKMPAVFTQYYLNPHTVNPALTGFSGSHRLIVNYRSHWSDFPDAPRSFAASYNGPATDKVGLGVLMFADNFGVNKRFRGQASYAYQFGSENTKMALGLSTDYASFRLDNGAFTDPQHQPGDPLINAALDGRQYFGATLGFYAEYKNTFFFGLSLPDVVSSRLDDGETLSSEETTLNYVATLGTWFKVPDYNFVIEPSLYLKKIGDVPLHVDINVLGKFLDDKLYGGLTYSIGAGNRFGFLLGARVNSFKVFYSYDVSYQDFQEYNDGSHEMTLSFDLFGKLMKQNETEMQKLKNSDMPSGGSGN